MAAILGQIGPGDWSHPDFRPKNYRQKMYQLYPNSPAKFLHILSMLKSVSTDDPEFKHFEHRLPDFAFTVNGAVSASQTTITLDAPGTTPAAGLKAGDMLRVDGVGETENMRVVADPVSPYLTIEVERYWGGTNSGGTIADNAILRWNGSAYSDGSRAPTAVSRQPTVVSGAVQLFMDSVDITLFGEKTKIRPMNSWDHQKMVGLEAHELKMEYALLYGVYAATVGSNNGLLYTTGGLNSLITTHRYDFTSTGIDLDSWDDTMEAIFEDGSEEKLGLCGNRALNIIHRMVARSSQGTYRIDDENTNVTYGMRMTRYVTPFGTLQLVPHHLMTKSGVATRDMFVIDTKYIEEVVFGGLNTKFKDNVQANDELGRRGFWYTAMGMRMAMEECHAVITGLNQFNP